MRQRKAIDKKYEKPDIFDFETNNYGLKPYMLHIKALKKGENEIEKFKEKFNDMNPIEVDPDELVSANTWLEVLEEKIQRMSNH